VSLAELVAKALQYQDDSDPNVRDGWSINSLSSADWALSRVSDLEAELAENNAVAEEAIARIQSRADKLNERVQKGITFFRSALAAYAYAHRDELLKGGKKKSRALLHGSLGWKKAGGDLKVQDREALLAWARTQPVEKAFLRIKEEPAVDEVKRHFKASGEIPPGCDVEPEREDFVVKTIKPGAAQGEE
jgi:phage host-nuclease inhibitor protein Gam